MAQIIGTTGSTYFVRVKMKKINRKRKRSILWKQITTWLDGGRSLDEAIPLVEMLQAEKSDRRIKKNSIPRINWSEFMIDKCDGETTESSLCFTPR